jgi:hypothetical protein
MEEMEKREMERTREARRLMRGVTGKRRRWGEKVVEQYRKTRLIWSVVFWAIS